jgi:CRISPR system Cascade subunit CasE
VLFRIEPLSHPAARQLVLVQSATAPDWQQLPEDYLCPPVQSKALTLTLTQGQVLGFRLVANPTKKARRDGQRQGRRLSLSDTATADGLTPAQQWLVRKGEQCGFELLQVRSEGFHLPSTRSASSRPSHFTKQQLPLYGVCFDGLLRVTDPDCLLETLRQGIGSAKAFGFGMLSLAPSAPLRS